MGYGEYIGGGSVRWQVAHTSGDYAGGGQGGGAGRDAHPGPNDPNYFRIKVDGRVVHTGECKGHVVRVEWGTDAT